MVGDAFRAELYDYLDQLWGTAGGDIPVSYTHLLTGHSPLHMVYRYYGTGDIGGSPTLESVRAVEKGLQGNGPVSYTDLLSTRYSAFKPLNKITLNQEVPGKNFISPIAIGCT